MFVAIVGDGHRQLPQISLLGGDVHHLVFTVLGTESVPQKHLNSIRSVCTYYISEQYE